jgi:hypothetical protein
MAGTGATDAGGFAQDPLSQHASNAQGARQRPEAALELLVQLIRTLPTPPIAKSLQADSHSAKQSAAEMSRRGRCGNGATRRALALSRA